MNKYYKAIDSVQAKQSSVDKAIAAARSAEESEQDTEIPKPKRKFNIKAVSAIAACLVAVLAVSAFFGNSGTENAFTIKANAATLNYDTYVFIGELAEMGGAFGEKENADGTKEYVYSSEIDLALNCEGNNIKSVKYTGKNCEFKILDHNTYDNFPLEHLCDSYTVNYNKHHKTNDNLEVVLLSTIATDDKNISDDVKQAIIDWNYHAASTLGKSVPDDYDDSKFDIQKSDKAIFTHLFKKIKIKAKVKFNDGTVETETIRIVCKKFNKNGSIEFGAKIDK